MPRTRRSILIVEDDDDLRRMFRTALSFAGFDVREANDGTTALRQIDLARPDLIVLDLVLPTLDGATVLAELASRTSMPEIPVVVVTGWTRDDLAPLNARCVLRKPVAPEELVRVVEQCLFKGVPPFQT